MARWRLMNPHYLNVPGTEWEYKETDQNTGRQARRIFHVPLFLDPNQPADQNYRDTGEIIVCHEGKGAPRDIEFVGPPTPDMEPLDDEAQAITDAERPKWQHPIESLSGSYSQSLLDEFQRQIAAIATNKPAQPAAPVSTNGIDPSAFAQIQQQVQALMEQNAALQAEKAERQERRA